VFVETRLLTSRYVHALDLSSAAWRINFSLTPVTKDL
jgi:hypothetical protein